MNGLHPNIALTPEEELHGALPFLDLLIQRPVPAVGRPFSLSVYQKDTHSDRYIHFKSAHPRSHQKNIFRGLLLRAHRLLRNHPVNLAAEIKHLRRVFTLPRNAYPERIIQGFVDEFQHDLHRNPTMLDLPKGPGHSATKRWQMQHHRYPWNSQVPVPDVATQNQEEESQSATNDSDLVARTPCVPTLFGPYVPGLSERLRSLSSAHGVRSWYSYGGKIRDFVSHSKDFLHDSKSQHAVYKVSCECGTHYIGESVRNLKIRVHEHELKSSKSMISLHISSENEELRKKHLPQHHKIDPVVTSLITQEKNGRKRKFIESLYIKSKAANLCNVGGSVVISDIWDPSLPNIAKSLKILD